MRKILGFILLCFFWVPNAVATSASISEKVVGAEVAEKLGFHRLIDGASDTWDNSWIILVYPGVAKNGQSVSDVCVSVNNGSEKLAFLCTVIGDSEINGFKRSDIEVNNSESITITAEITYGAVRYTLKDVLSLKGLDYESFKKRYNKQINRDNNRWLLSLRSNFSQRLFAHY